jgi:CBS domain-containing protein
MIDEDISSLVVVDSENFLAGILTRVDLLRAYMNVEDWRTEPVSRHMIAQVITVPAQELLSSVAETLLEKGIHRVVVVDEDNQGRKRPIAVVSAADLVYHMMKGEGNRWMRGTEYWQKKSHWSWRAGG